MAPDITPYAVAATLIFMVSFVFAMLGPGGGRLYVPVIKWLGFPLKVVWDPTLNTLLLITPDNAVGAAYSIHVRRSEELTCDLPTKGQGLAVQELSVDYLIDGCTVRFASVEARNQILRLTNTQIVERSFLPMQWGGLVMRTIFGAAR